MTGHSAKMNEGPVMRIASLRLAIGLLGERENAGWWASSFMSPTSTAFLTPVFGTRVLQARYQGVIEAAKRVHDERIGVGRAFHPFRLPEAIEQRVHDAIQAAGQEQSAIVSSAEVARATLAGLAGSTAEAKEGPTLIGTAAVLDDMEWVSQAASLYSSALAAGVQCFPYFRDA
jgi:hypothetical protein